MSSHVVVIDSTARRATVKTTPGKHLTDVLQEACVKLGVDPSQHGLKHKSKQLDLSLPFRLSGLTTGAKLELVQSSRSPSVVTVALQLPEADARGVPNGRLLDKFPSTTTLWLILRKFEAGVAGNGTTRNLTGRGVPVADGNSGWGAGKVLYEIPVVQALERELSTFADLQKSLAQLGFNSGNVLLRLSFRRTEQPIEEAMAKIQDYFASLGEDVPPSQAASVLVETKQEENDTSQSVQEPSGSASADITHAADSPAPPPQTAPTQSTLPNSSRPITVFSPPSGDTPQSAQAAYNENDYIPTVDHAKAHQRRLSAVSRNVRLPSDAEIAAKAAAEEEKLASIRQIDVKIRLPDQSQVVVKFGQQDSGKTLYGFVRSCLAQPLAEERFSISVPTAKGKSVVPDSDQTLLIKDLGMRGRVLVNFSWDEGASATARGTRTDILRPELQSQAQQIKVEEPPDVMDVSEDTPKPKPGSSSDGRDGGKPGLRKGGGIPKWLKLPGKK